MLKIITISLPEAELAAVDFARLVLNKSRSDYVRHALQNTLPVERKSVTDSNAVEELSRIASELSRLAWNEQNKEEIKAEIANAVESVDAIRRRIETHSGVETMPDGNYVLNRGEV